MTRHVGPWRFLEVIACLDRHVGLIWFAAVVFGLGAR